MRYTHVLKTFVHVPFSPSVFDGEPFFFAGVTCPDFHPLFRPFLPAACASLHSKLQSDILHCFPLQNRLFPPDGTHRSKKRNGNPQSAVLYADSEMLTFQRAAPAPLFCRKNAGRLRRTRHSDPPHACLRRIPRTSRTGRTRILPPVSCVITTSATREFPLKRRPSCISMRSLCEIRFYLSGFENRACQHIRENRGILTAKCGFHRHGLPTDEEAFPALVSAACRSGHARGLNAAALIFFANHFRQTIK